MAWSLETLLERAHLELGTDEQGGELLSEDDSCEVTLFVDGVASSPDGVSVRRVRSLPQEGPYSDDVLYVAGELPAQAPHVLLLVRGLDPGELVMRLADALDTLSEWDTRLLEAIAQRRSTSEVLAVGAQQLANPVALFDTSTALVAYAGELPQGYEETIWGAVVTQGYAPLTYYSADERERIGTELAGTRDPHVSYPRRERGRAHATVMAYADGRPYAMLSQVDLVAPFSPGQLGLLAHLRDRIEQMADAMVGSQRHASPIEHCVRLLLDGTRVEDTVMRFHLAQRRWGLDDWYSLAWCVPFQELNDVELRSLLARCKAALPDALVLTYQGSVVVVAHGDDLEGEGLSRAVQELGVCAGVSSACEGFVRLRVAYVQATAAVALSGRHAGLARYDELFVERLVDLLAQGASLEELCHPRLVSLVGSGDPQAGEYLRSLYIYMLCGCNVAKAAKRLYLHRNTLEYRMRRLAERIVMEFDDLDDAERLRVIVSCVLLSGASLRETSVALGRRV